MKITTTYLRQVIKEELEKTLNETLDEGAFDKFLASRRQGATIRKADPQEMATQFFSSLQLIRNKMNDVEYGDFKAGDLTWIDEKYKEPAQKKEFFNFIIEKYKKADEAQKELEKFYRQKYPNDTYTSTDDLLRKWAEKNAEIFKHSGEANNLLWLYKKYFPENEKALRELVKPTNVASPVPPWLQYGIK